MSCTRQSIVDVMHLSINSYSTIGDLYFCVYGSFKIRLISAACDRKWRVALKLSVILYLDPVLTQVSARRRRWAVEISQWDCSLFTWYQRTWQIRKCHIMLHVACNVTASVIYDVIDVVNVRCVLSLLPYCKWKNTANIFHWRLSLMKMVRKLARWNRSSTGTWFSCNCCTMPRPAMHTPDWPLCLNLLRYVNILPGVHCFRDHVTVFAPHVQLPSIYNGIFF